MESEQRSSYPYRKVFLGLAIPFAFLLLLWLAARPAVPAIGVGLSPRQSGHMGNFYSHDFVVLSVTNATTRNIVLESPFLEWEDGDDITAGANRWGGTNESCSVGPGQVMPLPIRVPPTSTKFKIRLGYTRDAGPLQKVFSPVLGRFFARRIGPNLRWKLIERGLIERGWLNGQLYLRYEGEWQINR
jgi:hypothetical protein